MADAGPTAVIEVRIHELAQLFNSLDPSPFKERDLAKEAEEHIVDWARELPSDVPIVISIRVPDVEARKASEYGLAVAISNYFDARAAVVDRDLRELFRVGRRYLSIGLPVLLGCFAASHWIRTSIGNGPLGQALAESLIIVGWVANWKPIETFLYDWWPLVRRRALYRRLADARVDIVTHPA